MSHHKEIGHVLNKNEAYSKHTHEHLFVAYRGSIAHGMYIPNTDPNSIDDIDLMGVMVPTLEHYLGLKEWGSRNTVEIKDGPWDIVLYESRKFFSLLGKGNPNVLSMLWLNEEDVLIKTYWHKIIEHRDLFVNKNVYHSFSGYAHDQLDKMTKLAYQGYMGAKRKKLVDQFGYDCKNAAHCIRLMRMCNEFLKNGKLQVDRRKVGDADELLSIKKGKWSIDQVYREADLLFKEAKLQYEKSPLPETVDWNGINKFVTELNWNILKGTGICI